MDKNYKNYVFRDGRFIGEFDAMYKNSSSVPWHQDKTANSLAVDIDMTILKKYLPSNRQYSMLDVGCGYGYIAQRLKENIDPSSVDGCDVSETAISKARELFPAINFYVADLTSPLPDDQAIYDCIYLKDILWYVTDELNGFVSNLNKLIKKGGFIYVMQAVPDIKEYHGKSIFPSGQSICDYFESIYKPVYSSVIKETYYMSSKVRIANDYQFDEYSRFLGIKR